ncbi:MAG: type VII secretion-associated serine protease mycosin [Corynebacteriales bacterium]|nr:type VII secretion-associated serine protease mycosin [Mycobacteriales bacterium]
MSRMGIGSQLGRASTRVLLALALALAVLAPALPAHADSIRDQQWQLSMLRAEEAWSYARGEDQIVAVIDSGVDASHPDLAGQVLPGADFVDGSTDGRTDVVGHGTTVAGLIAGRDDDSRGVLGLAPKAKILPVRVLDPDNEYDSAEHVASAIRWAVDHGATVINLSLGSADTAASLTDAVHYALNRDVVVVACDGNVSNDRGTQVWHPAREPGVLAVSGVNRDGQFWSGSLQGPETVLAAPAVEITGAAPGGGYNAMQGTSFASPLVAATAALVRSEFPDMDAKNVINRLIKTAWDFGPEGQDSEYGYGIVNPTRAVSAEVASVDTNPLLHGDDTGSQATGGPDMPSLQNKADPSSKERDRIGATVSIIATSMLLFTAVVIAVIVMGVRRRRRPRFEPDSLLAARLATRDHLPGAPMPPPPPPPPPGSTDTTVFVPPAQSVVNSDDQMTVLLDDDQETVFIEPHPSHAPNHKTEYRPPASSAFPGSPPPGPGRQ